MVNELMNYSIWAVNLLKSRLKDTEQILCMN